MSSDGTEIVRVEQTPGGALALGANPTEILDRATGLADALAQLVRSRGLALRLGDSERDFLTLPGWQALAAFVGVTPVVTSTDAAGPGAFRSTAEARTGDGRVVGAGVGLASRTEHRLRKHSDNSLAAMSQSRAMRRSLQGCLGWIPGLAGMDVSSPDLPTTRKQVTALHTLAGALEWTHEESHQRAGVESFNDLTREQAAELIDEWSALAEGAIPPESAEHPTDPAGDGAQDQEQNLEQLWVRAVDAFGSRVAVLREWCSVFAPDGGSVSIGQVTADELTWLIEHAGPETEGQGPGEDPGPDVTDGTEVGGASAG